MQRQRKLQKNFHENVSEFKMLGDYFQMVLIQLFNKKYRRKCIPFSRFALAIVSIAMLFFCIDVTIGKCTSDVSCMNDGVCVNGTCVCPDGWQGDECQFCGGKVRYGIFLNYFRLVFFTLSVFLLLLLLFRFVVDFDWSQPTGRHQQQRTSTAARLNRNPAKPN